MSIPVSESVVVQTPPREADEAVSSAPPPSSAKLWPKEVGGRDGLEPTRYGDWERNGRCVDF